MLKPILSVLVPTYKRAALAKISVDSVLLQETEYQIEVILSNNGADLATHAIFTSETYKKRNITYLETSEAMVMPKHWEWASQYATGRYFLVLPDRRLLKQGAIQYIITQLEKHPECDAACFSDDWLFESGKSISNKSFSSDTIKSTVEIYKEIEDGKFNRNCIPLGLNSIVRRQFIVEFRDKYGPYFDSISPDFSSGFAYLFRAKLIYICSGTHMITTGFHLSNGGKSYNGDNYYLKSLGEKGKFIFLPIEFEGNVWASIFEDYLRRKAITHKDINYRDILNISYKRLIITEELIKLIGSKFSVASIRHYLGIRRVISKNNWTIKDEFKVYCKVFLQLKVFVPSFLIKIYRYLYRLLMNRKTNIMLIAGFKKSNLNE